MNAVHQRLPTERVALAHLVLSLGRILYVAIVLVDEGPFVVDDDIIERGDQTVLVATFAMVLPGI